MVNLAQLLGAGDAERAQEVRQVERVDTTGARALLAGEPDLLWDRRQGRKAGELAGMGGGCGQDSHAPNPPFTLYVINWIITCCIGRSPAARRPLSPPAPISFFVAVSYLAVLRNAALSLPGL